MAMYRIYFLDDGAHISRPPVILECSDNVEAIEQLASISTAWTWSFGATAR